MKALRFLHQRLPDPAARIAAVVWLAVLVALALFFFGEAGGQFRYLNL